MSNRIFTTHRLKPVRQQLRQNMPEPERLLWNHLRRRQLGYKFRRQHSIGSFVVDFYCSELSLVIEIDGDSHFLGETCIERDRKREQYFQHIGLTVLRYTNLDIRSNIGGVMEDLLRRINAEAARSGKT